MGRAATGTHIVRALPGAEPGGGKDVLFRQGLRFLDARIGLSARLHGVRHVDQGLQGRQIGSAQGMPADGGEQFPVPDAVFQLRPGRARGGVEWKRSLEAKRKSLQPVSDQESRQVMQGQSTLA